MSLIKNLEDLEERIGRDWMRRIKLIVLTAAVYIALGCSKGYTNHNVNSNPGRAQEIKYSNIFK